MRNILITGGAGYVGSSIALKLKEKGFEPIIYDNLSSSHESITLEPKGELSVIWLEWGAL